MIKVNVPSTAESQSKRRGMKMRKNKQGRGFWSWLMGYGWDNGGANG